MREVAVLVLNVRCQPLHINKTIMCFLGGEGWGPLLCDEIKVHAVVKEVY